MSTRRKFILQTGALGLGASLLPSVTFGTSKRQKLGVQLYTFRNEMAADALGTLKKIAGIGIKEIESARSSKGHYYGMSPGDMKKACSDLGMELVSGHVHLDQQWDATMEQAAESGQKYLICSSMPTEGQTVDNYKRVAEAFNNAGDACQKMGLKFGYHNHDYEFESEKGTVLYDILLDHTDPALVHMELDLGWVIVGGKDPIDYFKRYPGRFPLWHLKDMDMTRRESTEFGKGGLDIPLMMAHKELSGVSHIFIEQEEYSSTPFESMTHNMAYMKKV